MGEIAEMHLDGTFCECCGEYMGVDEGYPVRCETCGADPSWHGAVLGANGVYFKDDQQA